MTAATKAKKATREFWISRNPNSDFVNIWRGKHAPKTGAIKGCPFCDEPTCDDNRPSDRFAKGKSDPAANECASEFQRITGIRIKEGEALLVRMTVVKRS